MSFTPVPLSEQGILRHPYKIYGKSVEGQELRVYLPQDGKPVEYLIISAIHGDEGETRHILSHALRAIPVGELRSAVILEANPDGCRTNTRCNANGVDLNRNFPSSDWSAGETLYKMGDEPRERKLTRGTGPGSEPETKALISLIADLKPKAVISLHSPLDIIDVPTPSALADWIGKASKTPVGDLGFSVGSMGKWAQEHQLHLITYEVAHASNAALVAQHQQAVITLMLGATGLENSLQPCQLA